MLRYADAIQSSAIKPRCTIATTIRVMNRGARQTLDSGMSLLTTDRT
jgi:hypothetical protein